MIEKKIKFAMIILIVILIPSIFAIPQSLTLNGKLTDSSGSILSGDYNMTFRFYSDYTGGSPMLTIANQTVSVGSDGIYHAFLEGINLTFVKPTYLGITVRADSEMSPRINLTSSPYSFRSNVTENLNASNNYELENLTANGRIGVGTSAHPNIFDLYNGGMTITSAILFGAAAPTYGLLTEGPIWIGGTGGLGELDIYEASPLDEATIRLSNADVGSGATDGYEMSMYTNVMFQHWLYENLPMVFATNNLIRMTIDANGVLNVSENVTTAKWINGLWNGSYLYTPNTTLAVQSLINDSMIELSSLNVTGTSYLGNMILKADNFSVENLMSVDSSSTFTGNITFGNYSDEFMRITGEGYVGIGKSNPSTLLHVVGDSIFNGDFTIKDIFSLNAFSFDHNTGDVSLTNDLSIGGTISSDLEVSGGNLNVSDGNLSVSGAITSNMTKVSAYKSGDQSIPDITITKITFDTENYDTLGEFSNSRFTANQSGYYEVYAHVFAQELGNLHRWDLYIYKNGALAGRSRWISSGASGTANPSLDIQKTFYLNAGNYIEIYCYEENGNARAIYAGDEDSFIEIRRIV